METVREHIHLIGIGGTGMSAIARVLHERGVRVSGSDRQLSPLAAELRAAGVQVFVGHAPENIGGASLVVRSSAVPEDNPEVAAARQQGIPVLKRAEFLGRLTAGSICLAVAGTHGKTTTTSMLALALSELGLDPSFIIGGVATNLGTNARAGKGPHFVIEADEYDHMFLGLSPTLAIVTNVEHDHPDCFPTWESFQDAFRQFAGRIQPGGWLVACGDNPGARQLAHSAAQAGIQTCLYGLQAGAAFTAEALAGRAGAGFAFEARQNGQLLTRVALHAPGRHNVLNALAVLAAAALLGLPIGPVAQALEKFSGAGRRFDVLGEANGVVIVDDYAHHPTEIRATISAARQRYPQANLWVVWQPHTYSRTQTLWEDFRTCFGQADQVLVLGVYAAREKHPAGFSMQALAETIQNANVRYLPELGQACDTLANETQPGSVVLVLSAGDADQVSRSTLAALKEREHAA